MNAELRLYADQLRHLLDSLSGAIGGLDEAQLNWRPPAPDTNSVYVIATHILGNAEAWVLGIACGRPVARDRPAEFRASGTDALPLVERAGDLAARIDEALRALPPASLDETRPAPQLLWGAGSTEPVTGRQALLHVVEHAAGHLGQIQVTRDLALAGVR